MFHEVGPDELNAQWPMEAMSDFGIKNLLLYCYVVYNDLLVARLDVCMSSGAMERMLRNG